MCTKLLVTLVECVVQKCSQADAVPILYSLLETMVEKLEAIHRICTDVQATVSGPDYEKEAVSTFSQVEKAKPAQGMALAPENPEEAVRGKLDINRADIGR